MVEETKLFIQKLQYFQKVFEHLTPFTRLNPNFDEQLEILRRKTETISESVKKENSLNAGGKFEWVDSVLIKVFA